MKDTDKFTKILLLVIAVLLFVIAIQLSFNISATNNAFAASTNTDPDKTVFKIESLGTVKAEGIKDIKLLPELRTFIIQLRDEVVVYRIVKEEEK
jgi:hypothetical protein